MTLPAASASAGAQSSFKKGILWVGVIIIVFFSTILGAPSWISWFGAIMVIIGIYYVGKDWFKQGRKKTAVITFGLIGGVVIIMSVVLYTTFSIRSNVTQMLDEREQVDREIEARILQMSQNPDVDINWYYEIDLCRDFLIAGYNLREVSCDAGSIIERSNRDCQAYNDALLICDRDSFLARELRIYLRVIS
jgi:hypothetical protein